MACALSLGALVGCSVGDLRLVGDSGLTPVDGTADGKEAVGDGAPDTGAPAPDASSAADSGCVPAGEAMYSPLPDTFVASLDEFAMGTFNSNPPSSGAHCRDPGQYSTYNGQPLPRCNYLENLARGGVVLTYNCPQGCPGLVGSIAQSLIGISDPDCPNVRVVITSDQDIDVLVAAAAWGYTWKASCFDDAARRSLGTFISSHLGSKGVAPRRSPVICR